MNDNPYQNFPGFVLRTPLFPLEFYKDLTGGDRIPEEKLKTLFKDTLIREAVFLASPPLYEELTRWEAGTVTDKKRPINCVMPYSNTCPECLPVAHLSDFLQGVV